MRYLTLLLAFLLSSVGMFADTVSDFRQLLTEAQDTYDYVIGIRTEEISMAGCKLSSNASDWQEGQHLEFLTDGNPETFWHSDWHGQVSDTHYIQIEMVKPITGSVSVSVLRRRTEDNHCTLLGLYVSNNGSSWIHAGDYALGNASYGQSFTSLPISFGIRGYRFVRLTIEQTTSGSIFSHFAEIGFCHTEVLGPSMVAEVGDQAKALKDLISKGNRTADSNVTEAMLDELRQAHDALKAEMERIEWGGAPSYVQQVTNLPALYINTFDGGNITSKTVYTLAKMWRAADGNIEKYDSMEIRGRGNSTWGMPKKPYRIKFKEKEKFLGKGYAKARSWTLMANCSDKTLLRNGLASFIGQRLGQTFVPAAEYVDLFLNGKYQGNYQISDQMQVHKKRVDVVEHEEMPDETTNITGGYLLQLGGAAGSDPIHFWTNQAGICTAIKSPDSDVIVQRQKDYIAGCVNDFESRLFGSNFSNPQKGYRPVIDSIAAASFFLTQEYSANPDGYYCVYMSKEQDDPQLRFGPIWDFDIAFSNCNRLGDISKQMTFDAGYGPCNTWFRRMWLDPWFKQLSGRVWHRAIADGLVEDACNWVDSVAQLIDESQQLNYQRWSLTTRYWDELVLFSTYQEGIDYLKQALIQRAAFLSDKLPNPEGLLPPPEKPTNPIGIDPSRTYYIYNVGNSHPADITDGSMSQVCTWEPDAGRRFSQQWRIIPVTGDYYRIVCPESQMAITDMAVLSDGTYNAGSQLGLKKIDKQNDRQLWRFVPTSGNYAIENKETLLAWNNSNGGTANGTQIISWTNNANNSFKTTRQWRIEEGEPVQDIETGIDMAESEVDYRVVYDRSSGQVGIQLALGEEAEGTIALYDMQGRLIGSGSIAEPLSMQDLPSAVYVLRWNVGSHSRSVKFHKP